MHHINLPHCLATPSLSLRWYQIIHFFYLSGLNLLRSFISLLIELHDIKFLVFTNQTSEILITTIPCAFLLLFIGPLQPKSIVNSSIRPLQVGSGEILLKYLMFTLLDQLFHLLNLFSDLQCFVSLNFYLLLFFVDHFLDLLRSEILMLILKR